MKNYRIYVYQFIYPKYREFLWNSLINEFPNKVFFYDKWNLLLCSLFKRLFKNISHIVLTDGNPKLFLFHLLIRLNPFTTSIAFTQLSRSKFYLKRLIGVIYLTIFFDKVLFYYEYEKNIALNMIGIDKFDYFNNTVKNISNNSIKKNINKINNRSNNAVLFLGRNTAKSQLNLLFDSLKILKKEITIYIVGVNREDFHNQLEKISPNVEVLFFGTIYNGLEIQEIALNCNYAIYPGDVGLSIIHYAKLGCMPIVHSDSTFHYPEYYSYKCINNFPTISFNRNNPESLAKALDSISNKKLIKLN